MVTRQPPYAHRGFSLLELSVVLGIIALIAGAGISMAQGALKAADRITTQERLNTIKLAIDSFAKTYGYLPCPYDRSLATSGATFGVENRTGSTNCGATNGTSFLNAANISTGGVPVRTLGLPDTYAGDAWGNKFTYVVSNNLINAPSNYGTQSTGLSVRYGDRTTWYNVNQQRTALTGGTGSSNGGNLRVTYAATGSLTTAKIAHISSVDYSGSYTPSAVAATTVDFAAIPYTNPDTGAITLEWQEPGANASYVVVSHGPDGRGAFPLNGASIPASKKCNTSATANSSPPPCTDSGNTVCIDIENCNNDSVFFDTAYNDGTQASQYFDDYIVWGSNDLFRNPVKANLYFSATSGCPVTTPATCELWCAKCATNYPGGDTTNAPPSSITSGAVLFKKVLTSDATTCSASCFWSGTTAAGYQKIP